MSESKFRRDYQMDPHSRLSGKVCLLDSIRRSTSVVYRREDYFFDEPFDIWALNRIMQDTCFRNSQLLLDCSLFGNSNNSMSMRSSDAMWAIRNLSHHVPKTSVYMTPMVESSSRTSNGSNDNIPVLHLLIKTNSFVEIRHGKTDVRKIIWIRHV